MACSTLRIGSAGPARTSCRGRRVAFRSQMRGMDRGVRRRQWVATATRVWFAGSPCEARIDRTGSSDPVFTLAIFATGRGSFVRGLGCVAGQFDGGRLAGFLVMWLLAREAADCSIVGSRRL